METLKLRRPARYAALAIAAGLTFALAVPAMPAPAIETDDTLIIAGNATYQSRRTGGSALYDAASNATYVAWSAGGMDIYVRSYSHATDTWSAPVKVGDWDKSSANAYHDYTMLEMLPDGRLAVFVADHSVSTTQFTAPNPHSASGTWSRSVISYDKTAYPEPLVIGNTTYLFYSQNTEISWPYRTYRYMSSTDGGQTWSAPQTIIDTGKTSDKFNEVYTLSADPIDGRACLTWTLAGGPGGHNAAARDLYAACFDAATNTMSALDGTNLGTTIGAAEHASTRVIDAPTTTTFPRPINLSAIVKDPVTGELLVGAGYYKDGQSRIELGRVTSATGIAWATVDTGTRSFLDLVWNVQSNGAEVLSVDATRTRVRTHLVAGATATLLEDTAIPYGNSGADAVWVANYVEDRSTISYIGYTINAANRDSDYSGTWPVFAGWRDSAPLADIALGKTTTASSVKNNNPDRAASKATDGDSSTRWGSEYVDDSWITVDLGVTSRVDSVRLNWEAAYGESYEIQVSDNGTTWTTVSTVTNGDGGVDLLQSLGANGRYVRMHGLQRATIYGYSLYEFAIYAAPLDLAAGAVATASSVAGNNPYRSASNAADGHAGTRWASTYIDPSWLQVDLGTTVTLSSVKLNWETAYGRAYQIQVSNDGSTWTTVYSTSTGDGGVDDITGLNATGRYVRMYGTQRGTAYGYSL